MTENLDSYTDAICKHLNVSTRPVNKEASFYIGLIRYCMSKLGNAHNQQTSKPCNIGLATSSAVMRTDSPDVLSSVNLLPLTNPIDRKLHQVRPRDM